MTRSWQRPSNQLRSNLSLAVYVARIAALALLVAALPAYAQRGGGGHGGGGGHAGGGGHVGAAGHAGGAHASHLVAGRARGAHLVAGSRYTRGAAHPRTNRYLTYVRMGGAVHHPVPGASTHHLATTGAPFEGPFDFFGGGFGGFGGFGRFGRSDRFGFRRGGYGGDFGYWPWWGWDEGWDDWETGCDYASPYYPACLNGQWGGESSAPSREESDYDTDAADAARPMIMVYLKDGSGYGALDYWLTNGTFYIETTYGAQKSFPLDQVDVQRTFTENTARGVTFTLAPTPLPSDPGPMFAPDSYAPDCPTPTAASQSSSSIASSASLAAANRGSWFGATGTSSDRGLTVASVRPDSPAALMGVQPGDVVVRVNCQHVHSTQDIESAANTGSGPIWVSYMIRGAWLTDKKISR